MESHTQATEEDLQPSEDVDSAGAEAPVEESSVSVKVELQQARQEAADNYDRYLRVHAEMENYKKRIERTYADLARNSKKDLLLKLLQVKDNLERALAYGANAAQGNDESVVQGVRLTEYQLDQVLRGEGVTPMDIEGQPYDPETAEALGTIVNSELPDHSIAEVVQQGYLYQDSVLRPAKVMVAVREAGQDL
jgi:molecular chaperone GrpE